MKNTYTAIAIAIIAATAFFCLACCMSGCTATTVRTATAAAPTKSGETVTTTKSETEMRLADDTKILDQVFAFAIGLF